MKRLRKLKALWNPSQMALIIHHSYNQPPRLQHWPSCGDFIHSGQ